MSKEKLTHTQCTLKKGSTFQIAWIPNRHAVMGKYLKLREDNGWEVIRIGSTAPSSKVLIMRDIYRHHRSITDI